MGIFQARMPFSTNYILLLLKLEIPCSVFPAFFDIWQFFYQCETFLPLIYCAAFSQLLPNFYFCFFLIDGLHFFFGDTAWQNSEMGPNGLQSCCWQGCTALESYSTECPCLLETSRACLQVLSLLLFLSPSQYGWYSVVHIISFWHWGSCLHLLFTRAFVIT